MTDWLFVAICGLAFYCFLGLVGCVMEILEERKESAMRDNCEHVVSVENDGGNCYVELSNDNDGYYVQQFSSSRELKDFIGELLAAHDEAFVTDGTVTRLLTLRIVQPEPRPFLDDYEVEADDG